MELSIIIIQLYTSRSWYFLVFSGQQYQHSCCANFWGGNNRTIEWEVWSFVQELKKHIHIAFVCVCKVENNISFVETVLILVWWLTNHFTETQIHTLVWWVVLRPVYFFRI